MYRVSWQDYRNWGVVTATREPPLLYQDFPTIDAARAERDRLAADGMTACVAPTPAPKPSNRKRRNEF